jgi:hypothetical protein
MYRRKLFPTTPLWRETPFKDKKSINFITITIPLRKPLTNQEVVHKLIDNHK